MSDTINFGKNLLTGGAYEAARQEAVASQLPGRVNGPADAYRHLLGGGELTRKNSDGLAEFQLWLQESADFQKTSNRAQDEYNNEIGKRIGFYVRQNGGSYKDVVHLSREVMRESLKGTTPDMVKQHWEQLRYNDHEQEILVNPARRIVTVEGQTFNSIALAPGWNNNPVVGNKRISDHEANWPDEMDEWLNKFNYEGASDALSYKGAKAYEPLSSFDYLTHDIN